jgi:protein-L-isoaspartate(D-aspartate) O-methyltransferase
MTVGDLQQARVRFAKDIQQQGSIKSTGLIEGLATIPRENFVGPGPWKTMRAAEMAKGYRSRPTAIPVISTTTF